MFDGHFLFYLPPFYELYIPPWHIFKALYSILVYSLAFFFLFVLFWKFCLIYMFHAAVTKTDHFCVCKCTRQVNWSDPETVWTGVFLKLKMKRCNPHPGWIRRFGAQDHQTLFAVSVVAFNMYLYSLWFQMRISGYRKWEKIDTKSLTNPHMMGAVTAAHNPQRHFFLLSLFEAVQSFFMLWRVLPFCLFQVIAAARAGFRSVGFELNPWLVWYSRYKAWRQGVHGNTSFYISDLWKVKPRMRPGWTSVCVLFLAID